MLIPSSGANIYLIFLLELSFQYFIKKKNQKKVYVRGFHLLFFCKGVLIFMKTFQNLAQLHNVDEELIHSKQRKCMSSVINF